MEISIQEIPVQEEEQLIIRCHRVDENIFDLIHQIKSNQDRLLGYLDDEIYRLSLNDIYYFETVDHHSFFYCKDKIYETKLKLYEFEEYIINSRFFRASKSTIVNAKKIVHVKPSLSGRFEVYMENGEQLSVSRQFVPDLKKQIGL